jgi:hypothetical protein
MEEDGVANIDRNLAESIFFTLRDIKCTMLLLSLPGFFSQVIPNTVKENWLGALVWAASRLVGIDEAQVREQISFVGALCHAISVSVKGEVAKKIASCVG